MNKVNLLIAFLMLASVGGVSAQGNIHQQGEGGVFTQSRLAMMKGPDAENADMGNNPWMMDLYSDMRRKLGVMGDEVNLTLEDIDGTIYLNEDFVLGQLYDGDVAFKRMYLRYDAYNDEVELRESPEAELTRAMVKNQVYSCSIGGEKFEYKEFLNEKGTLQEGYLLSMVSGERYKLYKRYIKVFKEGKPAKTSLGRSFPHRFLDRTEYYVSIDGRSPEFVKGKKSDILDLFSEEDANAVKKYIKDKHLNMGDDRDFVNVFAYANSL